MTDRFEVPEPSEEAVKAHDNAMYSSRLAEPLRAAYLVDVPRLCREEAEKAIAWYHARVLDRDPLVGYVDPAKQYTSLRFGEAAPEPTLASLYGSVPNLTGGKGSVEYVRETRDKCQCEGLVHIEGCPYRVPTPSAPAEPKEDAFDAELRALLNRHSAENGSDTPDHLLADFLRLCLGAFEGIVRDRDKWHGFKPFGACPKCRGGGATSTHPCACRAAPPSEAPAKPKCKYVGGGDCEPVAAARPEAGKFCLEHRVRDCSICAARGACTACGCAQCQDDRIWVRTQRDAPYPKVR